MCEQKAMHCWQSIKNREFFTITGYTRTPQTARVRLARRRESSLGSHHANWPPGSLRTYGARHRRNNRLLSNGSWYGTSYVWCWTKGANLWPIEDQSTLCKRTHRSTRQSSGARFIRLVFHHTWFNRLRHGPFAQVRRTHRGWSGSTNRRAWSDNICLSSRPRWQPHWNFHLSTSMTSKVLSRGLSWRTTLRPILDARFALPMINDSKISHVNTIPERSHMIMLRILARKGAFWQLQKVS